MFREITARPIPERETVAEWVVKMANFRWRLLEVCLINQWALLLGVPGFSEVTGL